MALKLIAGIVLTATLAFAQANADGVRNVLDKQVEDWNRGDIPEFVKSYADDAVFIGKEVSRGAKGVLERYRRSYPTRESMGRLTFSGLEVTMLGADHAMVIGRFALERSASGGGNASGIFSLVFRRSGGVWLIVLDHTSS